jgi:two-component system KDP operon response regulator KdpE
MPTPPVLLVDPDGAAMAPLERAGYRVVQVGTAQQADALYADAALVLTELDLPDQDGVVLVSEIRERSNVPIVVCSARASTADRVLALKLGADMAVRKPIASDELVARVRAVLRRGCASNRAGQPTRPGRLLCGPLSIDLASSVVRVDGRPLHLTPTEFRILALLGESYGEVVAHETIPLRVWGQPLDASLCHVVNSHIHRLRRALRLAGTDNLIHSKRAAGYVLFDSDHPPEKEN